MGNTMKPLEKKLPLLTFFLVIVQPLMDVVSFWINQLGLSNLPTLALRCLLLALTVLVGFCVSGNRKAYWIMAGICFVLFAGHLFAISRLGVQNLFTDLTNWVRVLQMPITAVSLISFLKRNKECYEMLRIGVVVSLLIILFVEVISTLTGTDPHTYAIEQMGCIGWFSNTNSQSAILTMLPPVAVVWAYQKKGMKSPWFWMLLLGSMVAQYCLATRLAYLGIAATAMGIAVSMLLIDIKQWKKSLIFVLITAVFATLIPISPMTRHQTFYYSDAVEKQGYAIKELEAVEDILEERENNTTPRELTEEELAERRRKLIEALTPMYRRHIPDFVEIFGLEETMEMYDFTYTVTELTKARPKKLKYAKHLMENSPVSSKVFGLELSRFYVGDHIYDVENDFHGIFYLFGGAGLVTFIAFIGYFLWLIVKALFKNAKQYFTLEAAAWGIALIMAIIHSYCTAGVLRRPNAAVYLSVTLAAIYYLVKIKDYEKTEEES